jgi:hypothetical protein
MINCRMICLQEILKMGMNLYDYGMTEHLRLFIWVVFTFLVFNTKVIVLLELVLVLSLCGDNIKGFLLE